MLAGLRVRTARRNASSGAVAPEELLHYFPVVAVGSLCSSPTIDQQPYLRFSFCSQARLSCVRNVVGKSWASAIACTREPNQALHTRTKLCRRVAVLPRRRVSRPCRRCRVDVRHPMVAWLPALLALVLSRLKASATAATGATSLSGKGASGGTRDGRRARRRRHQEQDPHRRATGTAASGCWRKLGRRRWTRTKGEGRGEA